MIMNLELDVFSNSMKRFHAIDLDLMKKFLIQNFEYSDLVLQLVQDFLPDNMTLAHLGSSLSTLLSLHQCVNSEL